MKKAFPLILALVLAAFSLAGCGGGTTSAPDGGGESPISTESGGGESPSTENASGAAELGAPVELSFGHLYPTSDYRAVACEYFAEKVAELSGGNITATIYPSQTLTTSQDAMKSVANGVADIAVGAFSFNVSEVPALAPLDIQGIYDPDYFWETYELIKPTLNKILETQGQMCLIMFDESESIFYLNEANKKEVHAPSDIAGLRLRDHGMWIGKSITAWGAGPMTIMPADLAVALERGTVDGGYTGWGFSYAYRVHESAPYITFTGIAKSCWSPATINLDLYNSLTQAQRDIILEAARLAEEKGKELLEENQAKFLAEVEEFGGTVYTMTQEETQVFVDATAPLIDEVRQSAGELGNELVDALLSAPSKYR